MLLTEKEILEKWPVKVGIPHLQGHYFLFCVHTIDLQGHAILGKSLEGVTETFIRKLAAYNIKPLSMYEIDIVGPSPKLSLQYAKEAYELCLQWLVEKARTYAQRVCGCGELPVGMIPCVNKDFHQSGEKYWDCPDCLSQCYKSIDMKKFEKKYFLKYLNSPEAAEVGKGAVSLAPPPNSKRKIYQVQTAFGHHNDGLTLATAPIGFNENVLFLCHATKIKIPKVVFEAIEKDKELNEKEQERSSQKRKEEQEHWQEEFIREEQKFWFEED